MQSYYCIRSVSGQSSLCYRCMTKVECPQIGYLAQGLCTALETGLPRHSPALAPGASVHLAHTHLDLLSKSCVPAQVCPGPCGRCQGVQVSGVPDRVWCGLLLEGSTRRPDGMPGTAPGRTMPQDERQIEHQQNKHNNQVVRSQWTLLAVKGFRIHALLLAVCKVSTGPLHVQWNSLN